MAVPVFTIEVKHFRTYRDQESFTLTNDKTHEEFVATVQRDTSGGWTWVLHEVMFRHGNGDYYPANSWTPKPWEPHHATQEEALDAAVRTAKGILQMWEEYRAYFGQGMTD